MKTHSKIGLILLLLPYFWLLGMRANLPTQEHDSVYQTDSAKTEQTKLEKEYFAPDDYNDSGNALRRTSKPVQTSRAEGSSSSHQKKEVKEYFQWLPFLQFVLENILKISTSSKSISVCSTLFIADCPLYIQHLQIIV